MQQITPQQLKDWLDRPDGARPLLLDVREPWEHQTAHIEGSLLTPMNSVPAQLAELDPTADVVVICHHGGRSMQVAAFLERNGFNKVFNLSGGLDAWARQVAPDMPTY
jgi:rhodanese-related sulfurtransferase